MVSHLDIAGKDLVKMRAAEKEKLRMAQHRQLLSHAASVVPPKPKPFKVVQRAFA